MKKLLFLMTLILSIQSYSQYKIYVITPTKKKTLEGQGSTFIDSVKFESVKNEQGVEELKGWIWAGNCGKTFIDDKNILQFKDKNITIRVKMESFDKCVIKSWEKF